MPADMSIIFKGDNSPACVKMLDAINKSFPEDVLKQLQERGYQFNLYAVLTKESDPQSNLYTLVKNGKNSSYYTVDQVKTLAAGKKVHVELVAERDWSPTGSEPYLIKKGDRFEVPFGSERWYEDLGCNHYKLKINGKNHWVDEFVFI